MATSTSRVLVHPPLEEVALTDLLFALSDQARLDLVRLIDAEGPQTVAQCHVVDPDAPKSTFSHHLKSLREAGLIRNEPSGRQRLISLRRAEVDERFPGVLDALLAAH